MLQGKNAVVTGARKGIGRACVEVFAKNGANIWACARENSDIFEQDMKKIAEKYKVQIWPLYFDMTNEVEIKEAVGSIKKSKVSVDVLANIAGTADESSSFAMTPLERMRHVFEVNFFGMTLLTQYVSRLMVRQKSGSIINISSVAGIEGRPAQHEYAASKGAVIGGVRQLAWELGRYNIRVNAVAPGMVDTKMGAQIAEELREELLTGVILKRMGRPEEIANVIAFLASDLSTYMTGQIIRVDGGI